MVYFDTHAHYYDARFAPGNGEGGSADEILPFLFAENGGQVCNVINIATNPSNFSVVCEQAARYPGMFAAVGIHPEDCQNLPDFDEAMQNLRRFLGLESPNPAAFRKERKIVAIGEIGLDYNPRHPVDKALQMRYLEAQLALAQLTDLPVIIHDREAHGDCFDAVVRHRVRGVFHCYSGSAEMAKDLCRRGFYIAFGGVVTYENAPKVQEAVRAVPFDRLLLETDCPYLSPAPDRHDRNDSGKLGLIAEAIAKLRGISPAAVAEQTAKNAALLFKFTHNGKYFVQL